MVSLSYTDINIPGQNTSYKKISITPEEYSPYFLLSYILLKSQIKAKYFPTIFEKFDYEYQTFINHTLSSCTSNNSVASINYFKSLSDTLKNEKDFGQMISLLDYYIGNQDCLNQILVAGYEMVKTLILDNNCDFDTIIKTEITKIIEFMVGRFSFSVDLFWSTSSYTYSNQNTNELPGLKFPIYYELISTSTPTIRILLPSDEYLQAPLPPRQVSPVSPARSTLQSHSSENKVNPSKKFKIFSSDHPKLLNLVTVLLKSVTEHKIYSKDIDLALQNAIQEDPDLVKINSINNIFNKKRATCDKHEGSEFIPASCGFEHCAECIYTKIKEEFLKPALNSVYCPCKSLIPAKFLVEVRKSEGFKQFMKKK